MKKSSGKKDIPVEQKQLRMDVGVVQDFYEQLNVKTRNILFCGCKSGKTTTVSVLENPCHDPKKNTSVDLWKPVIHTVNVENPCTNEQFSLAFVDSPSIFKSTQKNGTSSFPPSEEKSLDCVRKALELELTNLHNCFFFLNVSEDGKVIFERQHLENYFNLFGAETLRTSLVIPHSEGKDLKWRKNIVQQICEHDFFRGKLSEDPYRYCDIHNAGYKLERELKRVQRMENKQSKQNKQKEEEEELKKFKLDILFMGCVDPSTYCSTDVLILDYEEVSLMREIFLQYIFLSNQRVQLYEFGIFKRKKEEVLLFLNHLIQNFRELQKQKKEEEKQKLIEMKHREMMKKVLDYQYFYYLPDYAHIFLNVVGIATETAKILKKEYSYDDKRIHELIHPLKIEE